ncbi:MAG TPA: PAS domain S-box protein [Victivallales bacterium]|nr:PAS domain S-box protein [Victivallales bacterium]
MFYSSAAKKIRKEKKIKLIDMSKLMDINENTLYRWETGLRKPSANDIRIMAQILGISVSKISDLENLSVVLNNTDAIQKNSKADINKNLYDLDRIINEFGNIPTVDVNALKQLKQTCLEYQKKNSYLERKIHRYENILNQSPSIFYVLDSNYKFRYVNQAFILMSNRHSSEDIVGFKASDIFGMDDVFEIIQHERRVFNECMPIYNKKILLPCSNGAKTGLLSIHPIIRRDGKVSELICSIQDITEFSNLLNKLQNLESVMDLSDDLLVIKDETGRKYRYINNSIEKITGYKKEMFYKNPDFWDSIVHPNDIKQKGACDFGINNEGKFKFRIIHNNGNDVWIEIKRYMRTNKDTGQSFIFALGRDITEQINQNKILELLKANIDASNIGITIIEKFQNRTVYCNNASKKITGYSTDEIIENKLSDYIKKVVHPDYCESVSKLYENPESFSNNSLEFKYIRKDKKIIWIRFIVTNKVYLDETYQLRIFRDITEEKTQIETANLLKRAFDDANYTIWLLDRDRSKYIYISKSVAKQYKYPVSNFKKDMNFWINNCIHPEDRPKELKYMTNAIEYPKRRKFRIIRPDGEIRQLECSVHISNGYLLTQELDITEE